MRAPDAIPYRVMISATIYGVTRLTAPPENDFWTIFFMNYEVNKRNLAFHPAEKVNGDANGIVRRGGQKH